MALKIVGKVLHRMGWGGDKDESNHVELVIVEHKGVFKPKGVIKIHFDRQAAQDLFNHLGGFGKSGSLNGRPIEIIIG